MNDTDRLLFVIEDSFRARSIQYAIQRAMTVDEGEKQNLRIREVVWEEAARFVKTLLPRTTRT